MRTLLAVAFLLIGCGDESMVEDLSVGHDLAADQSVASSCHRVSDLLSQTCPSGQKCSYTSLKATPDTLACVPVTGSVAAGQPCTIADNVDAGVIGMDSCAKGLICVPRPQGTTCLKFCDADSDCGGALAFCDAAGVCDNACTLLGSDCPGGYSCTGYFIAYDGQARLTCGHVGTTAIGGSCTSTADCVADAMCAGTPKACHKVCNDSHACAAGTCTALQAGFNTTVLGYCK